MLVICLYDAVHGYQIQQLFIFLSKWNFKKFKNIMFYKKKTFKIVGSAAKVENERNISENIIFQIYAFQIEIPKKLPMTFFFSI